VYKLRTDRPFDMMAAGGGRSNDHQIMSANNKCGISKTNLYFSHII